MSVRVNASCLAGDDDRVFLGIRVMPENDDDAKSSGSYHLALLLDVSGSMDTEGRIQTLKRTLHILVDVMKSEDKLTLITYNSCAHILANACILSTEGKSALHTMIDAIMPEDCTNLESALRALTGVTVPVDAVFILTDGYINRGLMLADDIQKCICAHVSAGTPVHTLGYGADHNANLLRDIAIQSRGSYTFAEHDEMLPAIIGTICGGLEQQIGRDARLDGLTPSWKPIGAAAPVSSHAIGTLIADKPTWVVLEGLSSVPHPALQIRWTSARRKTEQCTNVIIDSSIDAIELAKQRDRARVAHSLVGITDCISRNNIETACARIDACCAQLDRSEAIQTEFVQGLYTQLANIRIELGQMRVPGGGTRSSPALCRIMADTTVLTTQHGFTDNPAFHTFMSPRQHTVSQYMTQTFSADEDVSNPGVPMQTPDGGV